MKFVGIILILYGVILVVTAIHTSMKLEDLLTIGQGVAMAAIGSWLASAAGALRDIATTEGNDIGYLMIAMRRLKSVYTLQAWAMGIACVLVGIAMVHALRH